MGKSNGPGPAQYGAPAAPAAGAGLPRKGASITEGADGGWQDNLWEDQASRKKRFRRRPIWTFCLLVAWIATAAVVLLTHVAVDKIIPPIKDLSSNVLTGFNSTFGFANLSADGKTVSDSAKEAMQSCFTPYDYSLCATAPSFLPQLKKSDTTTQLTQIDSAFDRTLSLIYKVTTDKCLAAKGFNATAENLKKVLEMTGQLGSQVADMYCAGSWPLYCGIYEAGKAISLGATEVVTQINGLAASPGIAKLTDYSDYLDYLHGLPYALVVSMVFFTFFWYCSGGVCCCCEGGNCLGCLCCLVPYLFLWLVYFSLTVVIVAIGFIIPAFAKKTKVPGLVGGCTISEVMTQIETAFTLFYDLVFKDLIAGCLLFVQAFQAALIMCLFVGLYSLCICFCRPYSRERKENLKRPSDTE